MRRDIGTDDPRVRVRAGKSSRPRTKNRPDWTKKPLGQVIAVDRGRYTVFTKDEITIYAIRAKELGRGSVIMGDRVRLTGDLSGRTDTLGRIVAVEERTSTLRRSLEDAPDQKGEKAIVANADTMVIVIALADPPPRLGMIDRCLVAAHEAGMQAILCLTKSDLADPAPIIDAYADFDIQILVTSLDGDKAEGVQTVADALQGHFSVLVGHSGVGKSTLINALVPDACRSVGHVNEVTGRGRHTSTSSEAFPLPAGGWIVDTPGVRSFGLGHVTVEDVLAVFPELGATTEWCLPLCTHLASEPSCALDEWAGLSGPFSAKELDEDSAKTERERRAHHVESLRRLLDAVATAEAVSKAAR